MDCAVQQDGEAVFLLAVRHCGDNTLAVNYEKLVALSFAAVKELSEEVNKLKKLYQI